MTENEYQLRIEQLEREVAELKTKLTAKQKTTRYGLVWEDVPEAFEKEAENKIPILEEVKDKAIKNDDGKPTHILIEGDNYHALQCLNYTHRGKVDVIYIDPPYNTGSDGFTYKDKRFLDQFPNGTTIPKEHPLRHSTWLSFMSKRLELAKNLLSEKGVIFISIDDNEQANLKLLCDKVFGEDSFVTTIHVEMSATQGMKVKAAQMGNIVKNAEYILVYSNDGHKDIARQVLYDYRPSYDSHYTKYLDKENNVLNLIDVYNKQSKEKISNVVDAYSASIDFREFVSKNAANIFRYDKTTGFEEKDFKLGEVVVIKRDNRSYTLQRKSTGVEQLMFLSASFGQCDDFDKSYGLRKIRGDWWKDFYKDMGNVSKEGNVVYQNGKKPLRLIQQIIKMSALYNSVVLDFFAGSGTTLHATIVQNLIDGGNRQCILVQQNEDNEKICETKTFVRCQNVMSENGNSLKYYRTAFVGNHDAATATDEDKVVLAHKAGTLIAIAENTLEEIETTGTYQIFNDGNRYTAIYFTGDLSGMSDFVEKVESIRNNSRLINISAYIYCLGNVHVFDNEFGSLKRIKLKGIPQPIIEIYKQLNA